MSHTATKTKSETTTDTTHNAHSLAAGDKVRIHGLKGRADLNGAIATVLDTPEAGKYKVELPSGEKVKVKQQNVSTTLTPPEGLPEDVTTVAADGRVTHRVALPAGGWELTMLEQDGLVLTATLAATDDELKGTTIRRIVYGDAGEDAMSAEVTAAVADGALTIVVPPVAAPAAPEPAEAPVEAPVEAPAELPVEELIDALIEEATMTIEDESSASTSSADDEFDNDDAVGDWEPLDGLRRSTSGPSASRIGRCKSRRKAARGRRAVADASEQRRAARARADGEPAWKKRASPIAKDAKSVIDLAA